MRGLTIRGDGVIDWLVKYTVKFMIEGREQEITIDDAELGNLSNYDAAQIMMEFSETYPIICSALSKFSERKLQLKAEINDVTERKYLRYKRQPFARYSQGEFRETDRKSSMSDKMISALINSDSEENRRLREMKSELMAIEAKVERLQRSIKILDITWETARSFNANDRAVMRKDN